MIKIEQIGIDLGPHLWFLPSVKVASNALFAVALIETNSNAIDPWLAQWLRLFRTGAATARGMLSMIAGSMISAPHDRPRFEPRLHQVWDLMEKTIVNYGSRPKPLS